MNCRIKKNLSHLISAAFLILFALGLTACSGSETLTFSEYAEQLFIEEVSSNTLTLHYTLKNPEDYGITDIAASLGDYSRETRKERASNLKSLLSDLKQYKKSELETLEALTYDVLCDYLQTQLALCEYELYEEVLLPSGGVAAEIPLLLAEYSFSDTDDIESYLALLGEIEGYFEEILIFEQEKADAGLFISDEQCQETIDALEEFVANPKEHYLITTFENKLAQMELSDEERAAYQEKNQTLVLTEVIGAYETLLAGLTGLMGSGKNDLGLYYDEQGREYYELLVYADTGCSDTMDDIFENIAQMRANDLAVCANLIAADESLAVRAFTYEWEYEDDMEMLGILCEQMQEDFPAAPEVSVSISAVDTALEEFMAPAFYITVPLDDYYQNTIYINGAYDYTDIYYFATLAHEGFPGHLYQTVMSYEYGLAPIRSILNYPGYTEGWATYVEMISYSYAGMDADLASLLMHNQAATLSLYASSDIGMHYYGWTMQQMYEFWADYGVDDVSTVHAIAELVLENPGNYLEYYAGYLCFLELKEETQAAYGDDYSDMAFHEAILRMGPAPFDLLEEYMGEYYEPDSE